MKIVKQKPKTFDVLLPIIIILSSLYSLRAAATQYYILNYGDDIVWVHWVSEHIHEPLSLLSQGPGYGYRPTMNLWYSLGYSLWGANEVGYYLLNGLVFIGAMVFLYKLITLISNKYSGLIAVLLYIFLDSTFILASKINFIASIGEILFITSSLYFSIKYFNTHNLKYSYVAVALAVLAFFNKEPSILIIPFVNIIYLIHEWKTPEIKYKIQTLVICLIPITVLILVNIFSKTDVGLSEEPLFNLILSRLYFYFNIELAHQFKNPYLIFIALSSTVLLYKFQNEKYNVFKVYVPIITIAILFTLSIFNQLYTIYGIAFGIMMLIVALRFSDIAQRIGLCWFIIAFTPLLVSALIVQPTYLAEANLGLCLFIGITLVKIYKHFLSSLKGGTINIILVVLVVIIQVLTVPVQIANTDHYNHMVSDQQTSFKNSVDYINLNVEPDGIVYYISVPNQITAEMFQQLLCLKGRCDIEVKELSEFEVGDPGCIALISNSNIHTFQTEYKHLALYELYSSIEQIQNGDCYAVILTLN